MNNPGDLKVWWIPQVPGKAFEVPVKNVLEAALLLDALARYDQFQLDNHIKPDYCNAGGLVVFEDGEWVDWTAKMVTILIRGGSITSMITHNIAPATMSQVVSAPSCGNGCGIG